MLHQRQTGASSKLCVNKGSVGSIFVPTRITEPSKRDAVTANIAVDRIGLILPQHYNEPVVHQAPVTPVAAGELFSSRALQQDNHACACFLPVHSRMCRSCLLMMLFVSVCAAPSATKPKLRLSWAGSGIYFWW